MPSLDLLPVTNNFEFIFFGCVEHALWVVWCTCNMSVCVKSINHAAMLFYAAQSAVCVCRSERWSLEQNPYAQIDGCNMWCGSFRLVYALRMPLLMLLIIIIYVCIFISCIFCRGHRSSHIIRRERERYFAHIATHKLIYTPSASRNTIFVHFHCEIDLRIELWAAAGQG